MYVIHKKHRIPGTVSYTGSTWDEAGLRDEWRDMYTEYEVARLLALFLSRYNPVGFTVSPACQK